MLCAAGSPVKYEGERAEYERDTQAGQPDLQELWPPVVFGRHTDAVAAREVDLREEEGRGDRQQGQTGENARNARLCVWGQHGAAFEGLDDTGRVWSSSAARWG